jgi:hypothetical protein
VSLGETIIASIRDSYRTVTSLNRSERRLLLEAASLMAIAWTGLRLLPFPTLRRLLSRYGESRARHSIRGHKAGTIGAVQWAIEAIARRFRSATCLVQALATDVMLRRRGLTSELCIGVRLRRDNIVTLEAHAWVECGGVVAIGALEDLSHFEVLTTLRS